MSSVALDAANPDADGLVGSVTVWPSDVLPSTKYMFAEGQEISRADYSLLFSRYGELHGDGDGSTTFNLPDYKQKFLVGFDAADAAYDTVGETGGSASGAVSGTTSTDGSHSHSVPLPTAGGQSGSGFTATQSSGVTSDPAGSHSHSFSGSAATIPPYNVVRYIVKVL